jgi:hypothetical protein
MVEYKVVCCYCGKTIGTKKGKSTTFTKLLMDKGLPNISHRNCKDCKNSLISGLYTEKTPKRNGSKLSENHCFWKVVGTTDSTSFFKILLHKRTIEK